MESEIIIVTSDVEDDVAGPIKSTYRSFSASSDSSSSDEADNAENGRLAQIKKVSLPSTSFPRSISRMRRSARRPIHNYFGHPDLKGVYTECRDVVGVNFCQSKAMNVIQQYIRNIRKIQAQVGKDPLKYGGLSIHVRRTLFLFKAMSERMLDTNYYYQKVSELLAMYTFYEIRFGSGHTDSKIGIAERIVGNINLHLKNADVTYTLRIFAHIPNMGKDNEVVAKVFARILPESVIMSKEEMDDRLYIQYLIAFYHWKEAQEEPEDQQKIIEFANSFMRPKKTLKSSVLYGRHLPSNDSSIDATKYFLTHLVYLDDLKNASLLDGVAQSTPGLIDLSTDCECPPIDYATLTEDRPLPTSSNSVKLEKRKVVATVDLTDLPDEAPWLTRLVRKAIELEVKLPRILTAPIPEVVPVVEIADSSDDESWDLDEVLNRTCSNDKETENVTSIDTDGDLDTDADSNSRPFELFDVSIDPPCDSSDELSNNTECTLIKQWVRNLPSIEVRTTFAGITESELNSLTISTVPESNSRHLTNSTMPPKTSETLADGITLKSSDHSRAIVANILRDFSEISTNLADTQKEDDEAKAGKTKPNESAEGEVLPRPLSEPPLKTYSRKKVPNIVDKPDTITIPTEKPANENILFSGKVISLRDDNGDMTPNYSQVPDAVEVPSQGSNVVFSMQGRRLSSFPALEINSQNENSMPDFDGELFEKEQENKSEVEQSNEAPVKTIVSSLKSKDTTGQKSTKRRSVWFSEEVEVNEIDSHEDFSYPETPTSSPIPSTSTAPSVFTSGISSTLNKFNCVLKQFEIATSTSTSTPTATSTSATTKNVLPILPTQTQVTPPSTSTSTTTASNISKSTKAIIEEIKGNQEKVLVETLFPDIFRLTSKGGCAARAPPQPKNQQKRRKQNVQSRPSSVMSNSSSVVQAFSPSSRTSWNTSNQIDVRRRSVTPLPGGKSDFDKYLQNLKKRRTKLNNSQQNNDTTSSNGTMKKRARARRTRNTISRVNGVTKSLVDITQDPKLTKLRPVVVIERLTETMLMPKLMRNLQTTVESEPTEKETVLSEQNQIMSSMVAKPGTESLGDFLVQVVEQQVIELKRKDHQEDELEKIRSDAEKEVDTQKDVAESQPEPLPTVTIPLPIVCVQGESSVQDHQTESEVVRYNSEQKPEVESEIKPIKMEEPEPESPPLDVFKMPMRTYSSRLVPRSIIGSQPYLKVIKTPPASPCSSLNTESESLAERLQVAQPFNTVATANLNINPLPPLNTSAELVSSSPATSTSLEQSETLKVTSSPKKQVKVRLKRCNYNYMVISNTALDDLEDEDPQTSQEAFDRLHDELMSDDISHNERKRRVKGSAARKGQALKRIFERVADEKENPTDDYNNPQRLFNATAGHNIDSINTPPPTPPSSSPSLSPALPADNKTPAIDYSLPDVDSRRDNGETNNNNVDRPMFPQFRRQYGQQPPALPNSASTSSDLILEFRQHNNIATEVEIDSKFLAVFYDYLLTREDVRAKEEINKLKPLLNTAPELPSVNRKRRESCSLSSLVPRQVRKLSTNDVNKERSYSNMTSRRRKTICYDSHNFLHSPDLLFDDEICSSTKAADSPTIEVMRLHTAQTRTTTLVSSTVPEENDEDDHEQEAELAVGPSRTPPLFSDPSVSSTPIETEEMETEIEISSGSKNIETTTAAEEVSSLSNAMVSRTYSKKNMVQHVFVPPEIEKCIEEQASTSTPVVVATTIEILPSSSSGQCQDTESCNRKRSSRRISYDFAATTEEDNDDANDSDYQEKKKRKRRRKSIATSNMRRGSRATKTSHRKRT